MGTLIAKRSSAKRPLQRANGTNVLQGHKAAVFTVVARGEGFSVREFCRSYGVTQDSFTRLAGFSTRAVAHWASGRPPSSSTQKRFTELTRLFVALSNMVDAKVIGEWLKQPNPAFDGSTPLQVIERGETDRIWRMIWELQSGNTG